MAWTGDNDGETMAWNGEAEVAMASWWHDDLERAATSSLVVLQPSMGSRH